MMMIGHQFTEPEPHQSTKLTETSDGPNVSPTQIGRFTKERVLSIGKQSEIQKRGDSFDINYMIKANK